MSERRDDDDGELLAAWARGDRTAGTELFERHYPSIARFFHNKVNETVQEDLIQETFLAALKGATKFRASAKFRTYLFGIARNVLAEHLRQLARRTARFDPEIDVEELPSIVHGLSPVANAVQREEHRLLLEALRRIPLIHQIALELRHWEHLTDVEIARVLGIPDGTAKTRLRDGLIYLQRQVVKLARSPEALRSTLENLERWLGRMRNYVALHFGADEERTAESGAV